MDRGAQWAAVRGAAASDTTERACMHVTSSRKPFLTLRLDRLSPLSLRAPLFTYCHRGIIGDLVSHKPVSWRPGRVWLWPARLRVKGRGLSLVVGCVHRGTVLCQESGDAYLG